MKMFWVWLGPHSHILHGVPQEHVCYKKQGTWLTLFLFPLCPRPLSWPSHTHKASCCSLLGVLWSGEALFFLSLLLPLLLCSVNINCKFSSCTRAFLESLGTPGHNLRLLSFLPDPCSSSFIPHQSNAQATSLVESVPKGSLGATANSHLEESASCRKAPASGLHLHE